MPTLAAHEDEDVLDRSLGLRKCECMFICKGDKEGAVQGDCDLRTQMGYQPSQAIEVSIARNCIPSLTDDRMCYGLEK